MLKKQTTTNEVLKLASPCQCNSCNHGCSMGSGFFINEELPKAAEFLGISVEELKTKHLDEVDKFNTKLNKPKLTKYPYGQCKFYDKKLGCTIHEVKPMECKVSMSCKEYGENLSLWFMLNHFLNLDDPESIRQFHTYLKAGGKTLPDGELNQMISQEKLTKILNYEVLR